MPLIIGEGEERDPASLRLCTRQGNYIPNARRPEQPPAILQAAIDTLSQAHPHARLRSITAVYNCMGLVFASRRTWVDPTHAMRILYEDGYQRVGAEHELHPGDVVIYRDDDHEVSHVAIILAVVGDIATASWHITVMSKWGLYGEYIHDIKDVPLLLGEPQEFWTDRRVLP